MGTPTRKAIILPLLNFLWLPTEAGGLGTPICAWQSLGWEMEVLEPLQAQTPACLGRDLISSINLCVSECLQGAPSWT